MIDYINNRGLPKERVRRALASVSGMIEESERLRRSGGVRREVQVNILSLEQLKYRKFILEYMLSFEGTVMEFLVFSSEDANECRNQI